MLTKCGALGGRLYCLQVGRNRKRNKLTINRPCFKFQNNDASTRALVRDEIQDTDKIIEQEWKQAPKKVLRRR